MAFATASDLATRLGRSFTADESIQASALLEDATAYLRQVLGAHVSPQRTSTVRLRTTDVGHIQLPDPPVVSVTSVTIGGTAVTGWQLADGVLHGVRGWNLGHPAEVGVTYVHGYTEAPEELRMWCCVLAAQMLANIDDLGALSADGVSAVRIDDYMKSWTSAPGYGLPEHVIDRLRASYGGGAHVVGFRS